MFKNTCLILPLKLYINSIMRLIINNNNNGNTLLQAFKNALKICIIYNVLI